MKFAVCAVLGLTLCTAVGCGPKEADNNEVIQMDFDAAKVIKDGLEGVAKSGRLGSNFGGIMSAARDLKNVDAAKGEAIEKALTELGAITDPAKAKAKAKEIMGQL